jgi:flagellar basal-body rod protein FlgB
MDSSKLFSKTIGVMEKSLQLRARQHDVIVSNIVNMDTPNYKAFELHIEEELGGQVDGKKVLGLTRTSPDHLPVQRAGTKNLKPVAVDISKQATLRGDGNTVDMDREMVNLSENSLIYRASSQIISKMFGALKAAIKSGK